MLKTKTLALSLAFALTAGVAQGAATWKFSDWDADGNLELTAKEFTAGMQQAGIYKKWDANANALIEENEFYGGLYSRWDDDTNAQLTEAEFNEGWGTWYGDETADFGAWDADGNGWLSNDEFAAGIGETEAYGAWDTDATAGLTEDEFYTGAYGTWSGESETLAEEDWNEYAEDDDWLF